MEGYKVFWQDVEVGRLINVIPDMWYLEGEFESNETKTSLHFVKMASKFEARQVILDPTKGIRAKLKNNDDAIINIIVMSIGVNSELFVRQVFGDEQIDWLLKNVPETRPVN